MRVACITLVLCFLICISGANAVIYIDDCATIGVAGETYVLTQDLTLQRGDNCFYYNWGQDKTLDLGGHTVTYDTWPVVDVPNPSFEIPKSGDPTEAEDWTFSGSEAYRANNQRFSRFGEDYTLVFPSGSPPQYVESTPVFLPAGVTYRAQMLYYGSITPGSNPITLTMPGVSGGCSSTVHRRPAPESHWIYYTCEFTPSSDTWSSVRISTTSSPSNTLIVDMIEVSPTPISLINGVNGAGGLEIRNGKIVQGNAKSFEGVAVLMRTGTSNNRRPSIHNLSVNVSGTGTIGIAVVNARNSLIYNNTIISSAQYSKDREAITPLLSLSSATNHSRIYDNIIRNAFQSGMVIGGSTENITTYDNDIHIESQLTNGFGIHYYNVQGKDGLFDAGRIYNNTINGSGRGISVEGNARNFVVENNTITMGEHIKPDYPDPDQYFGICANGIKIEGPQNVIVQHNNVSIEYYQGMYPPCPYNLQTRGGPNDNFIIQDNIFKAMSMEPETFSAMRTASMMILQAEDATNVTIKNNKFISNRGGMNVLYKTQDLFFDSNEFINTDTEENYRIMRFIEGTIYFDVENMTFYNTTIQNVNLSRPSIRLPNADHWFYGISWPITIEAYEGVTPVDASYVIKYQNGSTLMTGTTGSRGTVELKQRDIIATGAYIYDLSDLTPYTVEVTYGGQTIIRDVEVNETKTEVFTFDTSGIDITNIQCDIGSGFGDCNNVFYGTILQQVRATCTDDGSTTGVGFMLENQDDGSVLFAGSVSGSGPVYTFNNPDETIQDSGIFMLTVNCTDNEANTFSVPETWNVPWGVLTSVQLDPLNDISVADGGNFQYQTRVDCSGGECGDVTATLDPFDDTGWEVLYQETFDGIHTAVDGETYGTNDWLTFQVINGGEISIDNGYALVNTPDWWNAALIHSTNTLPDEYKIRSKVGYIDYEWESYSGELMNWNGIEWYNQNENGIYLLTITDDLCDGVINGPDMCSELWWHYHRKMVIDVDDHDGEANHPLYMVWMDPIEAPWEDGGNGLHCWSSGLWSPIHNWDVAHYYDSTQWYVAELEKKDGDIILRLYDQNENILEETTPVSWSSVAYNDVPDYMYVGEPHADDYEGSARIDDITLLIPQGSTLSKGGAVPEGSGTPFYTTNSNPVIIYDMKAGDSNITTWNVVANSNTGTYEFFVDYVSDKPLVTGDTTYTVNVTLTLADCGPLDTNSDGAINIIDLALIIFNQGISQIGNPSTWQHYDHLDVNGDLVIDGNDISTLLTQIGQTC